MLDFSKSIAGWVAKAWHNLTGRFHRPKQEEPSTFKPLATFQRLDRVQRQDEADAAEAQANFAAALPSDADTSLLVYAIGDVHGRADLLKHLLSVIETDSQNASTRPQLVFLGDYIDRGFQSRPVIQKLTDLEEDQRFQTTFLKGNHEQAMLRFLDDFKIGPDWAAFGGRETLISYNVMPPKSINALDEWEVAQDSLKKKIPEAHLDFLRRLQTHHQIGSYGFVHAGVRPGVPFMEQNDEDRLWIRDAFLSADQKEDLFIVHGHSPVDAPFMDHRRINVDTGAYFTGRLSAVRLTDEGPAFISNLTVHSTE